MLLPKRVRRVSSVRNQSCIVVEAVRAVRNRNREHQVRASLNEFVSADDAVSRLQSGMNVFVHGAAATPTPLLEAMCRRSDLAGIRLYHMHTEGPAPFVEL